MFEAIMNLLLLVIAAVVMAVWIAALISSDGKCHSDDCGDCPWNGGCPEEERRNADEDC